MKYFILIFTVVSLLGCASNLQENRPLEETKYKVGQIWNYHTRKDEVDSKIYIVKIDQNDKLGPIYHIYVDNLSIKNSHVKTGLQDHLPHLPVSVNTLEESITTLFKEESKELPDISDGYTTWKTAFDKGEGGVFTIPVKNIIEYIEGIVSGDKT